MLAGLTVVEDALAGSQQPRLVEWQSGDDKPPVITFQNVPEGFDDDDALAQAHAVVTDKGRDGLLRWVNGNILLSPGDGLLSGWAVAHEILHVYGFGHTSFNTDVEVLSPSVSLPQDVNAWDMPTEPVPTIHGKADACTKEGIQNAPPPQ